MGKFSYTWRLMSASWQVLKSEPALLLFPLCSTICCLIVMASFAFPAWRLGVIVPPGKHVDTAHQVMYYVGLFAFYFCNYFVITFFNTAIVACAVRRLQGEAVSVGYGFSEAVARIHLIAGWALLAATVGVILRIIGERSGKIGDLIASLLGGAFSIVTFLVVPLIVVENLGPIAAIKQSTAMLKRTWGEQVIGNFSFGLIYFLLMIPAFAGFVLDGYVAVATQNTKLVIAIAGVCVVYLILLTMIQTLLHSIFQAAVYLHTSGHTKQITGGFPVEQIGQAMIAKAEMSR